MLYRFYIGLNDKDEGVQVLSNANIYKLFMSVFPSCTLIQGKGIWNGQLEPCIICELIDSPENECRNLERIKTIKNKLNQDCILMTKIVVLKEELM